MEIMTFLNQITIKADVEKEKFFRYANYTSPIIAYSLIKKQLQTIAASQPTNQAVNRLIYLSMEKIMDL